MPHPCRTGNPGTTLHACEPRDADTTLCGENVDRETAGQVWGFKAVCSSCYPLREPSTERGWQAQAIRGREHWPDSSEEVLDLSPEQVRLLTASEPEDSPEPAQGSQQDEATSPDQSGEPL